MIRRHFPGILTLLVAALLLVVGNSQPAFAQGSNGAALETSPGKALGSRNAPITIEVFSDFQCPACRALYENTLRPLIDNYVVSGKVYLIHRDFPLSQLHKHSRLAARYANAAARIGKFEKVETALYAKQNEWAMDGNVDAVVAAVLTPAEMKRIRELVQSGNLDADIDKDVKLGGRVPVRSTPTVIVFHRGESYPLPPGGVSYSLLRQFLDQLLRQ